MADRHSCAVLRPCNTHSCRGRAQSLQGTAREWKQRIIENVYKIVIPLHDSNDFLSTP